MVESKQRIFTAVGFMSGTSIDGVDVALIKTDGERVLSTGPYHHLEYDAPFVEAVKMCLNTKQHDTPAIRMVEAKLTAYHIQAFKEFVEKHDLNVNEIDCLGFHGHTIDHRPDEGVTLQIGDGRLLAKQTGVDVVYNFRVADVKEGGQGAPLVPIYHQALLNEKNIDQATAILNIGGVANITYLPAKNNPDNEIIAFDTGPGNALINDVVHFEIAQPYDKDGKIAKTGTADQKWLKRFMQHDYFKKSYPKSLDRNDFSKLPDELKHLSFEDKVASLSEATIQSIVKAVNDLPTPIANLYICGGGRHNKYFLSRLRDELACNVFDSDFLGLNGDMLEAEAFGFFAVRQILEKPITFPLTTGAQKAAICGEYVSVNVDDKKKLETSRIA